MRARVLLPLLILAAASGCGRTGGDSASAPDVPNGDLVIAKVGGSEIRGKDLDQKVKLSNQKLYTEYKNAHNWRMVLDTMIEQQMVAWEAKNKGLENDPEFKRRMALARIEILNMLYVTNVINQEAIPKDEELRKTYDDNLETFRVKESARVAQIVVKSREEADAVRRELLSGANWDAMYAAKNTDPTTARSRGLIGWITETDAIGMYGQPMPELFHAAMATEPNGFSEPVQTRLGWSVLHVLEKQKAGVKSFEEVAQVLKDKAVNQKAHQIYAQRMQELREKYKVAVYEDKYQEFMTGPLGEKELFDLAQQTKDPKEKIDYYQRIVNDHPTGGYADKAQFMIGFTCSEELKDFDRAEQAFKTVLSKYPKSELAESARWMLANMRNPDVPHTPGVMPSGGRPVTKGS
jgi:peptidyl-prolyl cis-trans isomerase C